jgi:adenosylhomocysteine nucleosidase
MIGFLVPMEKETKCLLASIERRRAQTLKGRKHIVGRLGRQPVVVQITGTGKVRAAAGTQLLIDHFACREIFHFGAAGAIAPELSIGDFVIARTVVEHDFHAHFGIVESHPVAQCSKVLNRKLLSHAARSNVRAMEGVIVSGNEDIVTTQRRDELRRQFGGLSVDWESAATAYTCNLNRVPVAVIRAISDYAYEQTGEEFAKNAVDVCGKVSDFLVDFILKR